MGGSSYGGEEMKVNRLHSGRLAARKSDVFHDLFYPAITRNHKKGRANVPGLLFGNRLTTDSATDSATDYCLALSAASFSAAALAMISSEILRGHGE